MDGSRRLRTVSAMCSVVHRDVADRLLWSLYKRAQRRTRTADPVLTMDTRGVLWWARQGSCVPFAILADLMETGDEADLASLAEWVRSSGGHAVLRWSNGLRRLLPVDDPGGGSGRDSRSRCSPCVRPRRSRNPPEGAASTQKGLANSGVQESPVADSNRRPRPYHGRALPTELTGHSTHRITACKWGEKDSNLRRLSRRFYRPLPLAARASPRDRRQILADLS